MAAISESQLKWLKSLECVRLSDSEEDAENLYLFSVAENESLSQYIWSEAAKEDREGRAAIYVVKDRDGQHLFIFSLKGGLVFDLPVPNRFRDICEAMLSDAPLTEDMERRIFQFQVLNSLSDHEVNARIAEWTSRKREFKSFEKFEHQHDENTPHHMVCNTFPAIELGLFCRNSDLEYPKRLFCHNERSRAYKDALFKDHTLGEVVFWIFAFPHIEAAAREIGVQHVYLFASDMSRNNDLVSYYAKWLKFLPSQDYGTAKSQFNEGCFFMHQSMADIRANRESFIANFNSGPLD